MSAPIYIASAVRTPIGSFGGSLVDTSPAELGRVAVVEALKRAQVDLNSESLIAECILGNVLGAGHGMNIARQISVKAGLNVAVPAYTVNKVCGSGLKAVTLGAGEIRLGNAEAVVVGGVENMSQAAFVSLGARWGLRMGNAELKDLMLQDGLTDAFHSCHMGITAENIAEQFGISRADQDAFAVESQLKAQAAVAAGHFKDELVAVPLTKRGKPAGEFAADEYPRKDCTLESLTGLRPAFKKDGTVTAGNASGINDGAAALVLMSEEAVKRTGVKPLAEIVSWASAGVEPAVMGLGPVQAVRQAVKKIRMEVGQLDLIEANEAFAVQALAVNRELEFDPSRVNVSGGAIALGHPIGASGARILVTLAHGLRRTKKQYGLATLCVGGGQGIAVVIKSLG